MAENRFSWTQRFKRHLGPGMRRMLEDRPGRRFLRYYRDHRGSSGLGWTRVWQISLGWLLILAGIILWLTPVFPGLFLTIPGLGLLSLQSRRLSRMLDRSELCFRRLYRRGKNKWATWRETRREK
jgi:hypothetical protein